MEELVSRRNFLKSAAVAGAAVAGSALVASSAMADQAPAEGAPAEGGEGGQGGEGGGEGGQKGNLGNFADQAIQRDPAGGMVGFTSKRDGDLVLYDATFDRAWREAPAAVDEASIVNEETYDFVVIGAGHAGTNCARVLAEAGCSVVLLEKQTEEDFYMLGCDIGHINSEFLASHGVPTVDPIEFYNDWMLKTQNICNPALVMQFAKRGGEAVDAFMVPFSDEQKSRFVVSHWDDETGAFPNFPGTVGGQKFWFGAAMLRTGWQPGHEDDLFLMTDAYKVQRDYIVEKGGVIKFALDAQYLEKDADGRVTGVIVQNADGGYERFNGTKAVAVTAGDFCQDGDMCAEMLPNMVDLLQDGENFVNFGGRDGKGVKMCYWAGGRLEQRPIATLGGDYCSPGNTVNVWLDENCKRYCNEFFGDPTWTGKPTARMKHTATYYEVSDANYVERLSYGIPAHSAFYWNSQDSKDNQQASIDAIIAAGAEGVRGSYAADDLETLAGYLGLEGEKAQNFVDSINRYNEMAAAGYDEDWGRDPQVMVPLQPPYIAKATSNVGSCGAMMVTNGGIMTTGNQQVLDYYLDPIPGLYCSGNVCGRRFGEWYFTPITGVSIGMAVVGGYLLGDYLKGL